MPTAKVTKNVSAATGGGNVLCSTLISIKTKAWLYSFGSTSAIGTDEGSGGERPEQLIVHIGKKSGGRSGGNTALPGRNVGECQSA